MGIGDMGKYYDVEKNGRYWLNLSLGYNSKRVSRKISSINKKLKVNHDGRMAKQKEVLILVSILLELEQETDGCLLNAKEKNMWGHGTRR